MPRKWLFTYPAQHPADEAETWSVGLSERLLRKIAASGHTERLARATLIPGVLLRPQSIFEGWGRGMDDCWVYAGQPGHDKRSDTIEVPPPPKMCFLVLILPDGEINDWCWRELDGDRPGLPTGMQGEQVWPPT